MKWQETSEQTCSVARAMSIIGDRWTLLVIRQIFLRIRRFSDIQSSLGISKHRLADRLARLVEQEILFKQAYDSAGSRFEYKLTNKGLDLYPVIISLVQWGDKWMSDDDGVPLEYIHKDCAKVTKPVLKCNECDHEINERSLSVRPGPGILNKIEREELSDIDMQLYQKSFADVVNLGD